MLLNYNFRGFSVCTFIDFSISAFLAQGFSSLDAAVQGSLILAAASRLQKNSYSSTPFTLIQALEEPEKLKKALEE